MSRLKIFLIFILLANISIGQIKEYKGIVFDIFNNKIDGATVTNLRTNKSTISDCDGRFKIKSNKGDSISIRKENYLFHSERISRNRKMKIFLNYDILKIKSKIAESEKAKFIDDPNYLLCRCQPLFLIDGEPFIGPGLINMERSAIKKTKVLKGLKATDMFGEYASSGAIFLTTVCGYDFDNGQ